MNDICPHCGKPAAPSALDGLCPGCMIKAAVETQNSDARAPISDHSKAQSRRPFTPPSPIDLAAHFPGLDILELIGQGGMGAVYKTRQKNLDRLAALKILAVKSPGETAFAERFSREAKALARLSHPNIVTVYDFGTAGGFGYFLMEFIDGLTLRQMFQLQKLTPGEALAIVPQICEALQYAHNQGIVHRDIKPENVLLDKSGKVKIADFGIAKIMRHEEECRTLTGANDVVGTPHYMAPEQIEQPLEVDHRADIYSLGVVFYEMLTGELPIGRFQPPSAKVQMDVRLDEVVLRSLEKERERRYQYASDVKTAVETISSTSIGQSPKQPENMMGQCLAWLRIHRKQAFILIAVILSFVVVHVAILNNSVQPFHSAEISPVGTNTTAQMGTALNRTNREVLQVELRQAEDAEGRIEKMVQVGMAPPMDLELAQYRVKILKAELAGDWAKVARIRLLSAERRFLIETRKRQVGVQSEPFGYENAWEDLEVRRAEFDDDPIGIAKARYAAAQLRFEIAGKQMQTGTITSDDYEKAKSSYELRQTEYELLLKNSPSPKTKSVSTANSAKTNISAAAASILKLYPQVVTFGEVLDKRNTSLALKQLRAAAMEFESLLPSLSESEVESYCTLIAAQLKRVEKALNANDYDLTRQLIYSLSDTLKASQFIAKLEKLSKLSSTETETNRVIR